MSVRKITGNENKVHFRNFAKWFSLVPEMRRRFCDWNDDFDPFYFNETATVGFLANAASHAGFLVLTEFSTSKLIDAKKKNERHGRCDLWLATDLEKEIDYAIEFKQLFAQKGIGEVRFRARLKKAEDDAAVITRDECRHRFAGLIITPRADIEDLGDMPDRVDGYCREFADYAYRFDDDDLGPVWLAFTKVKHYRPVVDKR